MDDSAISFVDMLDFDQLGIRSPYENFQGSSEDMKNLSKIAAKRGHLSADIS